MARAMETAGISLRELKPRRGSDPVGAFLKALARVRAALEPPDQVEVTLECLTETPLVELPFAPAHAQFTRAQRATGTQSFDDQIYFAVADMLADPAHRAFIQQRFDHVLVDEFQDLNGAQLALVDVLSRPHRRLFVVGDDDQLIYGWRQADPRGILEFHARMPPRPFSATYTLCTNYRCSRAVVETGAPAGGAQRGARGQGDPPARRRAGRRGAVLRRAVVAGRAAAMCAFLRAEKARLGCDWRDLAVLCRYRTQQLLVALALDAAGIPRTPALGATLFTHPAATLLRAYLDLVRAPDDLPGPVLAALLNRPNRYLSTRVVEAAGAASRPWAHVRETAAEEPPAGPRPLSTLVELVAAAREQLAAAVTSEDLVWTIVETFGLDDLWAAEADAAAAGAPSDGAGPLDVFDSLLLLAETYPDPEVYLRTWDRLRADEEAHVGVADDTLAREESEEDRVVIVTIHASKGREYHSVVIPDYDCDVSRWGPAEVEEERRVVYVGVTRARDAVLFTVDTSTGFVHPFLRELVEEPEPGEHETLSAWLEEPAGDPDGTRLAGTPDDAPRDLIADRLAEIGVLFPELVPEPRRAAGDAGGPARSPRRRLQAPLPRPQPQRRLRRRDEVLRRRLRARPQVLAQVLLQLEVGDGAPLVLAHVLVPAEQHEGLDVAVVAVGVAVHRPVGRSGAAARPAHQAQGEQEVLLRVLAHLVSDDHERRAVAVLRADQRRLRLGHRRGAQVHLGDAVEPPPVGEHDGESQRESPRRPRPRHPGPAGHLAPQGAAERDAGRDRREVQREAARADPPGQHLLRRDVERREAEQPADAGDHAERHRRRPVRSHRQQHEGQRDQPAAHREHPVGAETLAHPRHEARGGDRAEADAGIQDAQAAGAPVQVRARVDGHAAT